jgi:hypothetical protein
MNQLVDDLPHLREFDDLADLMSGHVIEVLPCKLLLLLNLSEDLFRHAMVLP